MSHLYIGRVPVAHVVLKAGQLHSVHAYRDVRVQSVVLTVWVKVQAENLSFQNDGIRVEKFVCVLSPGQVVLENV